MFKSRLIPLVCLCLLGASATAEGADTRTVRFGLVEVEPLVFSSDGRPEGFFVGLLEEVAADRGWHLQYVPGTWDRSLARLAAGEIDLLAPVARTVARDSLLDFTTRPALTLWSQVYVAPGSDVRTILDLADRTVAVMKGDINGANFRRYVERFGIDCRILEQPTLEAVFTQVTEGRVAAGVAPNVFGYTHAGARGLVPSPIIFEPYGVHFAVPAGRNTDLLMALDGALQAGQDTEGSSYHRLLDRWFGAGAYRPSALPRWIVLAVAGVAVLALVLGLWNRSLNLEVRRRTRQLRRSQERFRAIFANNFQLTGLLTPAGLLIEANPASLTLAGVKATEVIGRPFWECAWWSHDPALQARVREAVGEAAAGTFVRFEATHPAADGTLRLIDFSLKPVYDDEGLLIHLLPEGRDVTGQRHGEIRYRNLFESAGDAIFIMDGGTVIECNARALEIFRCDRDWLVGAGPDVFSPPCQADGRASAEAAAAHIACAVQDRVHTFEWKHQRRDGSLFDAEVSLTSCAAAGLVYLQAIVRDVTARKQLEADLRHAQKMEAIGTLAGGIAHDFNNILAAILGFGELARFQAEHDPLLAGNIDQIMRAGERARDLVRQILAFSRRAAEHRRPVALAPIVAETLDLLRSSIPTTIALHHDLRVAGPVVADPTGLHQVVMNLCTNAYQALAATGGRLEVSLREVEAGPAPGPWVVLEVRDDGPGMSAGVQAKIFEPYYTTKGAERGTGLGLAVVHGIVQEHKGLIEVESAPGKGALFRVWLPRRTAAEAVVDQPAPGPGEADGSERVLLVDDEPDIVRVGELGLARYGYTVAGFTSPLEALAALRAAPGAWDVVVTDMTMPGLTGLALAAEVRRVRPELPVLLCTGYSEGLSAAAVRTAGVRAVVLKPMVASRLAAEIRAALDAGRRSPLSVPAPGSPPDPVPAAS